MTLPQHSAKNDKWGTPIDILDAVRAVLGVIDFDPASSPRFNVNVGAKRFIAESLNSLVTPWQTEPNETIYLNPPGGRQGKHSLPGLFWRRLISNYAQGSFGDAIFMGFTLECLRTTQYSDCSSILDFPFCVPRKRLRFIDETGKPGTKPAHANVIVYVPCNVDRTDKFVEVFSQFGAVRR